MDVFDFWKEGRGAVGSNRKAGNPEGIVEVEEWVLESVFCGIGGEEVVYYMLGLDVKLDSKLCRSVPGCLEWKRDVAAWGNHIYIKGTQDMT